LKFNLSDVYDICFAESSSSLLPIKDAVREWEKVRFMAGVLLWEF
jgi:hypothetical protein